MVRAVLDTNVLISGVILARGIPFAILEAWRNGLFRLVSTLDQRAELADVITRPKFATRYGLDQAAIGALLLRFDRDSDIVAATTSPIAVRDPDDARILAAALAGNADFLVSGDADLLVLADDPRIGALRIVTPRAFLSILPGGNNARP